MAKKTMKDLLVLEMSELFDAETQSLKGIETMSQHAADTKLKEALKSQWTQTEGRITRLKKAFDLIGHPPKTRHSDAMEGLISDVEEIVAEKLDPAVLDAALIAQRQKMKHYEIAGYGTIHAFAEAMGNKDLVKLFEQSLNEAKQADAALNAIAMGGVNRKAMQVAA